jgi:hypothetical protein
MVGDRFIQIAALPQDAGAATLYALDESGQVWVPDLKKFPQQSVWTKVAARRETGE